MHGVAHDPIPASSAATTLNLARTPVLLLPKVAGFMYMWGLQALDGFSLCLWQLGEADGALASSNVFALLHRLSVEPDQLLRRSIVTAVGALSHPGKFQSHQYNVLCHCFNCLHLPMLVVVPTQKHKDLSAVG